MFVPLKYNLRNLAVRRLSTILWAVGILLALVATNTPGGRGYHRLAINAVVIPGALLAIAAVWCFPWQRYHRDLFVVTIAGALVIVPLMIAWSGGWGSPFVACLYFIVVFAALYFRRGLALAIALAVTLALASPLLFGHAPPGGGWGLLWLLLVNGATALAIVVVGRAMADEMLRLYGVTVERLRARQRAEGALQRANEGLERRVAERTADLRSANGRKRRCGRPGSACWPCIGPRPPSRRRPTPRSCCGRSCRARSRC